MANRQIAGLTAENSLDETFVIPVQKADGSEEAKKVDLAGLVTTLGITPVVKVAKITITESEVLTMNTTPIVILESLDSAKIAYPINVYIKRNAGTAYVLASSSFSIINETGSVQTANLNPNPLLGTSDGYFQSTVALAQNNSGGTQSSVYKLRANTGDPTSGTGDLDVYVTYIEMVL